MTPIAAYFIFTADEQNRASEAASDVSRARPGPSLVQRLRALAAILRPRVATRAA